MTKRQVLKHYVKEARRRGYKVKGNTTGGGWVVLANACGIQARDKGEAKRGLAALLGDIYIDPKKVRAPWEKPYVETDEFLSSYEWRKLRMEVIKKYGRRCMCCGATPEDGVVIHVDHIKPRKKYPDLALEFDNLQVLCEVCNHGKGNWDQTDWRGSEGLTDEQQQHLRDILH